MPEDLRGPNGEQKTGSIASLIPGRCRPSDVFYFGDGQAAVSAQPFDDLGKIGDLTGQQHLLDRICRRGAAELLQQPLVLQIGLHAASQQDMDLRILGKPFNVVHLTVRQRLQLEHHIVPGKIAQSVDLVMFSALHPRWSMELGLNWAKHSRLKRIDGKEPAYMGENNEYLVLYTKEYLKSHPNINYFIYGHRHIELDLMLSSTARILILGDWINYFSYAVFDGENLFLENFVEGETKL